MKTLSLRSLFVLSGVAFASFGTFNAVQAQSLSITDMLKEATFGYVDPMVQPEVTGLTESSVDIVAPIVKDLEGQAIYIYKFVYSPYLIESLATQLNSGALTALTGKTLQASDEYTPVTFSLSVAEDQLDPTTSYYGMILPENTR